MRASIQYLLAAVCAALFLWPSAFSAADQATTPSSNNVRAQPFFNWALVRVLDPYGNGLPGAGVWVNPRSGAPVRQLRELSNGWYIAGFVRRGLTDVTALHTDYTLKSVLPLYFSPTKPLAIGFAFTLENDATLEGYITDGTDGHPIHPAFVTALRAPADDPGLLYGATYGSMTDEFGHFYYPMASGFYDGLLASAEGYENFLIRPYNAPSGLSTLNFELYPVSPSSAKQGLPEGVRIEILDRGDAASLFLPTWSNASAHRSASACRDRDFSSLWEFGTLIRRRGQEAQQQSLTV